jgi:hypothetical protein
LGYAGESEGGQRKLHNKELQPLCCVLLAIFYHNNGNNEEGTGGDCNVRSLMKNKYKILAGNDGRATLIGSNRCALENSTNPVKPLRIYWEILDKITNCLIFKNFSAPCREYRNCHLYLLSFQSNRLHRK